MIYTDCLDRRDTFTSAGLALNEALQFFYDAKLVEDGYVGDADEVFFRRSDYNALMRARDVLSRLVGVERIEATYLGGF